MLLFALPNHGHTLSAPACLDPYQLAANRLLGQLQPAVPLAIHMLAQVLLGMPLCQCLLVLRNRHDGWAPRTR